MHGHDNMNLNLMGFKLRHMQAEPMPTTAPQALSEPQILGNFRANTHETVVVGTVYCVLCALPCNVRNISSTCAVLCPTCSVINSLDRLSFPCHVLLRLPLPTTVQPGHAARRIGTWMDGDTEKEKNVLVFLWVWALMSNTGSCGS